MKYFEMFAGIGGFRYGIERALYDIFQTEKYEYEYEKENCESDGQGRLESQQTARLGCIGYSEIDKYAIQIYEKHYRGTKNYGDSTEINPKELPNFELLVGGFPCQAFSIAGKRKGFQDVRGTLFFEIVRILKDKRPRYILLENVKGLLSHEHGKTFQTILKILSDIGYLLQWEILNSKNFGVPQNRERVFIIGHLRGERKPEVFPIGGICKTNICKNKIREIHPLLKATERLSDAFRIRDTKGNSATLKGLGGGMGAKTGLYAITDSGLHGKKQIRTDILPPLRANTGAGHNNIVNGIRRLTPVECERLQGFPDGWTEGISDTQRYKCLGNAVTTNVVSKIISKLFKSQKEKNNVL